MNTKTIEVSGLIIKEEKLRCIDTNIIPNTLVLETISPFEGYYLENPKEELPQTVYLFTKDNDSIEEIALATQKIKKYSNIEFDASRADVSYHNETFPCIRLYDIKDYNIIKEIQKAFQCEGVKFLNKTNNIEVSAIVKLYKTFLLNEFESGLYQNLSKSPMGYFVIKKHFTFKHFMAIVKRVQNNWEGQSFDAAYGIFFRKNEAQEVVRIFTKNITNDIIIQLNKAFQKEIDRLD